MDPGPTPQYYQVSLGLWVSTMTALPLVSGHERKREAASDSVRMRAIVNRSPDRIRLDRDCERSQAHARGGALRNRFGTLLMLFEARVTSSPTTKTASSQQTGKALNMYPPATTS